MKPLEVLERYQATDILFEYRSKPVTCSTAISRLKSLVQFLLTENIETVAVFADNQPDWVLVDMACQQLEICCIPLPLFFSSEQIKHTLLAADVDMVLSDQYKRLFELSITCQPVTTNALQALQAFRILKADQQQPDSILSSGQNVATKPVGTSKITFTSGSTGSPKGVCLSYSQQWEVARSLIVGTGIQHPRHLCVLPLATLLENIAGIYAPLLANGTILLEPMQALGFNGNSEFAIKQFLQTLDSTQADTLILLPQLLSALVCACEAGWQAPESLRYIAVGGGHVSTQLLKRAANCQLPVFEGYGLSEAASVVSLNTPAHNRPGSTGQPLKHVKIEIENNEIVVHGAGFLGYLGEPDSWYQEKLYTGDHGYLDENGHLFINGRKKNLLISSYGRNIHPEWIESEVLASPLIRQCILIGDNRPFCTALIFATETIDDDFIQGVVSQVNAKLPDYARIKNWLRLNTALSQKNGCLTSNGKPIRTSIMKHYQNEIETLYQSTLQTDQSGCSVKEHVA